jgi:hypothetical protein
MTVFWITGTNDVHQMRNSCAPAAGGAGCSTSRVDSARTDLVLGDVFLGVGVAGLAAGAILLVTHAASHPKQEAARPALEVSVAPVSGGAVAGAFGRF